MAGGAEEALGKAGYDAKQDLRDTGVQTGSLMDYKDIIVHVLVVRKDRAFFMV